MVGAPDQPGSGTAGDPTHALFADQSHSFPDNLVALFGRIRAWNYSAETARSAVGCSPRSGSETVASQAEHCCHPASRLRSFRSARSSSGSPLLEVDLPRRRRAGTAGDAFSAIRLSMCLSAAVGASFIFLPDVTSRPRLSVFGDDRKSRWPQAQFVEPRRPDPRAGNRQDAAGNRRCMQGRSPQPCRCRACPAQAGGPHRRARWETLRHTVNQDGPTGRALTTGARRTACRTLIAREFKMPSKMPSIARGTDGSNPSPSSSESGANLSCVAYAATAPTSKRSSG